MTDPAIRAKWFPPTLAAAVGADPFTTLSADDADELELLESAERERIIHELHAEDEPDRWWWR